MTGGVRRGAAVTALFVCAIMVGLVLQLCSAAAETVEVAPGVKVTKRTFQAPSNEQPFFGFVEKSPSLREADETFVASVVKAFGSRKNAFDATTSRAWRAIAAGNIPEAAKRFNQAFLLTPEQSEVFHGFAIVVASRFDDALNQIKQLEGEVATANVDTKDVTDQFVDLQARLAAKQSEEQRYLALLNRASTIDEILKVDAALTNVRTQVEQLTAQINSIKSRTEFSTIVLSVTPLTGLPVDNTAKGWDPAKTLARALAAVSALFQVLADLAIWALVFGFVPLIGLAVVAMATRGRRASAPTAPTV